jgi:hypothetical protein
MEGQRKARAGLVTERAQAAEALAELRVERGGVAVRATIAESEAAPIRYVADLIGADTDRERSIRWVIAPMVVCSAVTCSPSP